MNSKTKIGKRIVNNGETKLHLTPLEDSFALVTMLQINLQGKSVGAYVLRKGVDNYLIQFGFECTGVHSTLRTEQIDPVFNAIESGLKDLPPGERLTIRLSSFTDDTTRQQQLKDLSETAPNKELQFLLMGERCRTQHFFNTNIFQLTVRGWLIALAAAFQWIIEICMLLTALLGPLAVGGSLLPVGQKAIFAWLTGFFSVGMIKLCFNIISGLVATMVLNADNNDPMIFAFAIGLLAPILSIALAAGGGLAVFRSFSSIASFGLSTFVTRIVSK